MSIFQKHKLEHIYYLVKPDLSRVEIAIKASLKTGASLAALPMLNHILNAPGKRIRPILAILSFYACIGEVSSEDPRYKKLMDISSALELIHTASLIHDDVIDNAMIRRDQRTINAEWGNEAAVALGVYVYSVSLILIARAGLISILADLSETVRLMCEGELFQLADRRDVDLSVDRYLSIVERKTAVLFSTACFSGAAVSGASDDTIRTLQSFGRELGFLFQLTDDYLDFFGKDGDLKKELGQDIEQGQMTLPLLLLRDRLSKEESDQLVQIIREGRKDQLGWVVERMQRSDISTEYSQFMSGYISRATESLSTLPASRYRDALKEVLDFIVERIVY